MDLILWRHAEAEDEEERQDQTPAAEEETPADAPVEEPADPPADDGSQRPFAKALKALHNHHKGLSDYAAETSPTHDHPEGLALLQKHAENAVAMQEECKSFAKEHYPDLDFEKFCKSEETPDENGEEQTQEDDEDEDALDDFDDADEEPAAESEDLDDMGGNDGVPKSLRGGCKFHAGELTKMLEGNGNTDRDGHLAEKDGDDEDAAMEKALQESLLVFKSAKTA